MNHQQIYQVGQPNNSVIPVPVSREPPGIGQFVPCSAVLHPINGSQYPPTPVFAVGRPAYLWNHNMYNNSPPFLGKQATCLPFSTGLSRSVSTPLYQVSTGSTGYPTGYFPHCTTANQTKPNSVQSSDSNSVSVARTRRVRIPRIAHSQSVHRQSDASSGGTSDRSHSIGRASQLTYQHWTSPQPIREDCSSGGSSCLLPVTGLSRSQQEHNKPVQQGFPVRVLSTPLVLHRDEASASRPPGLNACMITEAGQSDKTSRSRSQGHLVPTTRLTGSTTTSSQEVDGTDPAGRELVDGGRQMLPSSETWCSDCRQPTPLMGNGSEAVTTGFQSCYPCDKEDQPVGYIKSALSALAPCRGKLRLCIETASDKMHVHIFEGKSLRDSNYPNSSEMIIKVSLIPDKYNSTGLEKSFPVAAGTTDSGFAETFTLNLSKVKPSRRMFISVYSQPTREKANPPMTEFIGGMSFGIASLKLKSQLSGWYYLLNENTARRKHLRAIVDCPEPKIDPACETANSVDNAVSTSLQSPLVHCGDASQQPPVVNSNTMYLRQPTRSTTMPNYLCSTVQGQEVREDQSPRRQSATPNRNGSVNKVEATRKLSLRVSKTNQALNNMLLLHFVLPRGPRGFGLTLSGSCPVYVSHVEPGSPAQISGLLIGDFIVAVNQLNVSRSSTDSVVRMFRLSSSRVSISVCRPGRMEITIPSVHRTCGSRFLTNLFNGGCFQPFKRSSSAGCINPKRTSNSGFQLERPICPVDLKSEIDGQRKLSSLTGMSQLINEDRVTKGHPCATAPMSPGIVPGYRELAGEVVWPDAFERVPSTAHNGTQTLPSPNLLTNQRTPSQCIQNEPSEVCFYGALEHCIADLFNDPTRNGTIGADITHPERPTELGMFGFPNQVGQGTSATPILNSWIPAAGNAILNHLRYMANIRPVDFKLHSCKLDHYGGLSMLEGNCCSKVELLMFPEVLLITQRAPNRFLTVIKDPVYYTKIYAVNTPPFAPNLLVLQYRDDQNLKQVVHLQSIYASRWLGWIQDHIRGRSDCSGCSTTKAILS